MTGEVDLVVVRVNHPIVASAWHCTLTLRIQKAILYAEIVVNDFVTSVVVLDVVSNVRHAYRKTCPIIVVIGS